jgi:hypothetical protein
VLGDVALWETDLTAVPGLADAVAASLATMLRDGATAAIAEVLRGA